nr:hypothetical protein [Tanacetum cinerariifolium]
MPTDEDDSKDNDVLSSYAVQPVTKCYQRGIEVSQGKDCVMIKKERYARKILKEADIEDCNETLYPMENDLKLSKGEDEPQYRNVRESKNKPINDGLGAHKVQGDEIVTWCARVTLFDSGIQGVIVEEFMSFGCSDLRVIRKSS